MWWAIIHRFLFPGAMATTALQSQRRVYAILRAVGVQNGVWGWGTPRSAGDQEEVPLNKNTMRNLGALLSPTQGHSSRCLLVSYLCLSCSQLLLLFLGFCFFQKNQIFLSYASSTLNASAPPFRHGRAIIKYLSVYFLEVYSMLLLKICNLMTTVVLPRPASGLANISSFLFFRL